MPSRERGKFVTFEGLDGVGKTTQMEKLAEHLRQRGCSVLTTREPGGTPMGDRLRALLLDVRTSLSPMAELALMFAARAQHIDERISPALELGQWVLCDRFTDSSEAYQGGGRQLGGGLVLELHRSLCRDLWPDLTFLLAADMEEGIARARGRNLQEPQRAIENDRFESETAAFRRRVHAAYREIARREPHRVIQVDTSREIGDAHREIVAALEKRFPA